MPQVLVFNSNPKNLEIWKSRFVPAAIHCLLKDRLFNIMAIQHDYDEIEFEFPVENLKYENYSKSGEYLSAKISQPLTVEEVKGLTDGTQAELSNLWFYIGPIESPMAAFKSIFNDLAIKDGSDPKYFGEATGVVGDGEGLIWWNHIHDKENEEIVKNQLKKLAEELNLDVEIAARAAIIDVKHDNDTNRNMVRTAEKIAGGWAGSSTGAWAVGAALTTSAIFPGDGTVLVGVIGAIAGGIVLAHLR